MLKNQIIKFIILILINIVFVEITLISQSVTIPIEVQLPIFLKILTFDRSSKNKLINNKHLTVGIVYQSGFRTSLTSKNEIMNLSEKFGGNELNNKDIIFKSIEITNFSDLKHNLSNGDFDVIILTPLRTINIEEISSLTQKLKILSFSLTPEYLYDGISISLELKAEKPLIVMNLNSAKAEGAEFSSQLLKLCKIIE